jgi:hypothetical protein
MQDLENLMVVIQQLESASGQAQDLIGDLGVEQSRLRKRCEQLLRRAVVAELALRKIIAEVNPHLGTDKKQAEFNRLIGEAEDHREQVQKAVEMERLCGELGEWTH